MDDGTSLVQRDIRATFHSIAQSAEAIELLMGRRFVNVPPHLMAQAMSLRNLRLVFVSDEDPTLFRAHTKLRNFVDHVQGTVTGLHALDEDHAALLNACAKLHSKFLQALEAGEDGAPELDDFESWAYALGDAIDVSLARFDTYLGSNFSSARTLRQRVELNKEAVAQAGSLATWLSALGASPLRARLSEEAACAPLLYAFDEALFTRGKMARRLERCTACIERLRQKLNSTQIASHRHALLARATLLDERGFAPFSNPSLDLGEQQMALVATLTTPRYARTPATLNPCQPLHARLFGKAAAKAARWACDLGATLSPDAPNVEAAAGIHGGSVVLDPKPIQKAFEAFLDDLFETGSQASACAWLADRHELGLYLDISLGAFLAWSCSQSDSFYAARDVGMSLSRSAPSGLFSPGIISDVFFAPELAEEFA